MGHAGEGHWSCKIYGFILLKQLNDTIITWLSIISNFKYIFYTTHQNLWSLVVYKSLFWVVAIPSKIYYALPNLIRYLYFNKQCRALRCYCFFYYLTCWGLRIETQTIFLILLWCIYLSYTCLEVEYVNKLKLNG